VSSGHLYIIRHGKAEDEHRMGDFARALTEDGRQDFRAHAEKLATHMKLTGIATSPLVRAVQTAELLSTACRCDQVIVRNELEMDQASARSVEALARVLGVGWALVGHNPSLAEAVAHLTGHGKDVPRLRKGAVVALTPSPSGALPWTVAWTAAPGHKRKGSLE
jgi:phosphohistidine phosphatase